MTSPAGPPGPEDPAGEGQATLAVTEHALHVDDRERCLLLPRRVRRAGRGGHVWAAAGSRGGDPSCARTGDRS